MKRPIYETKSDRSAASRVLDFMSSVLDFSEVREMEPLHTADFLVPPQRLKNLPNLHAVEVQV